VFECSVNDAAFNVSQGSVVEKKVVAENDAGTESRVTVNFTLLHAETQPGQHMILCGAAPEIGSWDPDRGIVLTTDAASYPTWSASVSFAVDSMKEPMIYKYIHDYRGCGGGLDWEKTERQFEPPKEQDYQEGGSERISRIKKASEVKDIIPRQVSCGAEFGDAAFGA